MIVEMANLQVAPERAADFVRIFAHAQTVLQRAHGLESSRLLHDVDDPGRFVIEVHWATLEDHVEGFVHSDLFEQFKEIVGPFLQGPPAVSHLAVATT
jgi:heme-degrading monooxygenase HmoA